jgi:hypothetical protein
MGGGPGDLALVGLALFASLVPLALVVVGIPVALVVWVRRRVPATPKAGQGPTGSPGEGPSGTAQGPSGPGSGDHPS